MLRVNLDTSPNFARFIIPSSEVLNINPVCKRNKIIRKINPNSPDVRAGWI